MKIINHSQRYNISHFTEFEKSVTKILDELAPQSLKEIIITPSDHTEYTNYVNQYSDGTKVTNNNDYQGEAITLSKLKNNSLEQFIVMKDFYFFSAINFLFDGSIDKITEENQEIYLYFLGGLFHEIGHARDYDKRFTLYKNKPSLKSNHDLLIKEERELFFIHEASTLWSEFIAQYFSETIIEQNDNYSINELNSIINNYEKKSKLFQNDLDEIYYCFRLTYYISLVCARIISRNNTINDIKLKQELKSIVPEINCTCMNFAILLKELFNHPSKWNYNLVIKYLSNAFLDIIKEMSSNKISIPQFDINKSKLWIET